MSRPPKRWYVVTGSLPCGKLCEHPGMPVLTIRSQEAWDSAFSRCSSGTSAQKYPFRSIPWDSNEYTVSQGSVPSCSKVSRASSCRILRSAFMAVLRVLVVLSVNLCCEGTKLVYLLLNKEMKHVCVLRRHGRVGLREIAA